MNLKFALTTLLLLATWLLFENFNILSTSNPTCTNAVAPLSPDCCKGMDNFSLESCFTKPNNAIRIKKVVLDAGHGGKDPGCIGVSDNYEKHNALAIVLKLGALIQNNYPEIDVIYTRDTDVFVELKERADIANRNNADLFISVHCNAMSVSSSKGTETYVLGLHKASHNLEVAKRENASIYMEENYKRDYKGYDPDSPEAHILGSMWQSAYLEQSILLAGFIQQNVKKHAKREDRGVKQAGFIVLKETAMPAVLVETGYMTNTSEDRFLLSEEGRDQMALSIFYAFEQYKNQMEGNIASAKQPRSNTGSKAAVNGSTPAASQAKPVKAVETDHKKSQSSASPVNASVQKAAAPTQACRIWLLSWNKKMDVRAGQLSLLSNVKEVYEGGAYHYYTEQFSSCEDAEKMLPEIKNLGFKNARLVK